MKRKSTCLWIVLILGTLLLPVTVMAGGWQETFEALSEGKTIQEDVPQADSLYAANYNFTITDGDSVLGNFVDSDLVEFSVSNIYTGEALTFPEGTKVALIEWAEANADKLFSIIFNGAPDSVVAGESNANFGAATSIARMFGSLQTISAEAEKAQRSNTEVRNNDIRLVAQYDFFEVGPQDIEASGSSGVVSYSRIVGETASHAFGVEIPYRSIEADDNVNSSMIYLMLNPFWEYSTTSGPNRYIFSAGLNLGATYLESDIFDDGGGYFQYGGMFGGGVARTLMERLEGRAALSYQYLKRDIPESQVDDEYRWIAQALNDADAEQLLTPAVGATYWAVPGKVSIDTNLFRIHSLGSDVADEYKYQTVFNAYVNYITGNWRIMCGYKTSFEVEDFTDRSIVASLRYLW